jgi:hypothetical protein
VTPAFASDDKDHDPEDGISSAEQVCAKQFLPSDVRTCLAIVRDAKYFSVPAVEVCGKQFLPQDQRNCLTGIRDKTYRPAVLDACGKLFLPSEIVKCLVENGKPWSEDGVDLDRVRDGVRKAMRHLHAFEIRRAEAVLKDLLKYLEN